MNIPSELLNIRIPEGKKMILTHRQIGEEMWIIMLTTVKGQHSSTWHMPVAEYWKLEDKHIPWRDRIVRERFKPSYIDKELVNY